MSKLIWVHILLGNPPRYILLHDLCKCCLRGVVANSCLLARYYKADWGWFFYMIMKNVIPS